MLYRRGKYWHTRFTVKGVRVRQSAGTADRAEAERFEARLKNDLWNQQRLDKKPSRIWQDAVANWMVAKQSKRSFDYDLMKLEWLEPYFNDKPLEEITTSLIEQTLDKRGVSDATRNRYVAVVRGVLKRAHHLGWIASVPVIEKRKEHPATPRFLTSEEAQTLIEKLSTPRRQHLADMATFALATGMRESNVTGLLWKNVNIEQKYVFVEAERYKGKRTFRAPLNEVAINVLKSRVGLHPTHVFSYRGKPVKKANREGFKTAKTEAGLPWLRWHDLRHTWASWHVMAGTPLAVLKELGGWSDLTMVMRYAHLAPDFAEQYAGNVAQNLTQKQSKTRATKCVND